MDVLWEYEFLYTYVNALTKLIYEETEGLVAITPSVIYDIFSGHVVIDLGFVWSEIVDEDGYLVAYNLDSSQLIDADVYESGTTIVVDQYKHIFDDVCMKIVTTILTMCEATATKDYNFFGQTEIWSIDLRAKTACVRQIQKIGEQYYVKSNRNDV